MPLWRECFVSCLIYLITYIYSIYIKGIVCDLNKHLYINKSLNHFDVKHQYNPTFNNYLQYNCSVFGNKMYQHETNCQNNRKLCETDASLHIFSRKLFYESFEINHNFYKCLDRLNANGKLTKFFFYEFFK